MLLKIQDLSVVFRLRREEVTAIDRVSLSMEAGERIGLVGESGAGKSVLGFSIINLISNPGVISGGSIHFQGQEISSYSREQMRAIRGKNIAMIFQDPMVTLNPVLTVEQQMSEVLRTHTQLSKTAIHERMITSLEKVCIPSPESRLKNYPHELSGGMRQRVIIAIALLQSPKLIIADEPTTALDVTVQAEIIALLVELCENEQVGLILITHDLAIVSQVTKRIFVLYAGRIIESGNTQDVINNPMHPYTKGLIAALPQQVPIGEKLRQIPGSMPSLNAIPTGCAFHPRCGIAEDICQQELPQLYRQQSGRCVRCYKFAATEENIA